MSEAPGSGERAAAARVRFPPPRGLRPLRASPAPAASSGPAAGQARSGPPRAAAAPPAGRGGQRGRKEPEPGCHRVRTGAAAAAGTSRGPESEPNALLAACRVLAPAGAAAPPAHAEAAGPEPASALCSSSPPRTGLHSGAAPAAAAGAAAADRGALQVVPGEAAAVPGQDVLQVHLHPAARRGGGKAAGSELTTGRGWRRPTLPAASARASAARLRGGARPGRALLGRRGAGASGLVRSRPPSSPSCPPPAWVPMRPREGGRGCPGRTGAPGRRGGRLTPGCGRGGREHLAALQVAPPDSRTVNLLRKKVVSMEQDKRNGQTWLGLGF